MCSCLRSRTFVRVIGVRLLWGRHSFPFVFPLLSRVNGIRLELTAVEDRRVLQGFSEQLARLRIYCTRIPRNAGNTFPTHKTTLEQTIRPVQNKRIRIPSLHICSKFTTTPTTRSQRLLARTINRHVRRHTPHYNTIHLVPTNSKPEHIYRHGKTLI